MSLKINSDIKLLKFFRFSMQDFGEYFISYYEAS